jgi:predicted DNA-binding transcriptional regulator AlpA
MDYEFTLKFKISEQDHLVDDAVERLGVAGCDDALVGIGVPGRIALSFTRSAESAQTAILSALVEIKRALPSAQLIEAGPDWVGLTDVAEIVGVSRQNIRKLMVTHPASFPPPVHDGNASIWHLALVLQWLQPRGPYPITQSLLDVAHAAMQINIVKEAELLSPEVYQELRTLVVS